MYPCVESDTITEFNDLYLNCNVLGVLANSQIISLAEFLIRNQHLCLI